MPTIPQFDGPQFTLICGSTDIPPYSRVTLDASGLAIVSALAADESIGTATQRGGKAGEEMTVRSHYVTSSTYRASGAIAVGDDVTGNTTGRVQSGGAGVFIGKAASAASADGDAVHVINGIT